MSGAIDVLADSLLITPGATSKNKIKIPMIKEKRSLNLAVSVAITLSENLRQTKWIMK